MITKTSIIKTIFCICMVLLFTRGAFPNINGQGAEFAFHSDEHSWNSPCSQIDNSEVQIKQYLENGATYILQASAIFDKVLQIAEGDALRRTIDGVSEFEGIVILPSCLNNTYEDADILKAIICTIGNLEAAKGQYSKLVKFADPIPYSRRVQDILRRFRYGTYFFSLIPEADITQLDKINYQLIEKKLIQGQVKEIFMDFYSKTELLLLQLNHIKSLFNCQNDNSNPITCLADNESYIVKALWRANVYFCDFYIFGRHVSEVFEYLKMSHANGYPIDPQFILD